MTLWSNTHLHKGQQPMVSELGEQHPVLTKDCWSDPSVAMENLSSLPQTLTGVSSSCSNSQGSPARQMLTILRLKRNIEKKQLLSMAAGSRRTQDLNNVA